MLTALLSSEKPKGLSERAFRILIRFGWLMASKSSALSTLKPPSSSLVNTHHQKVMA